ncbi:pimeloyl-ACP methyl ester carboxylesterase [Paenibacillus rhizosphaerae]|uniref:Pimeloyl-ACP methyl ester carboxylesterase n=1 Tax=Paenibacillus rhizosphaerae TaxID=297318 RepID=A0A839TNY3_9BACL|nr:alpha/beta hydrolase [Paenibacillus rhizosphaerae]MBB3126467.1 pimeloyl-ACP methyl ester carboxylesterase [Paenibacillus rhizosphaerae]
MSNALVQIVMRKRNQQKNAQLLRITAPEGIAESGFVRIGGIEQWVTVRGENRRNPVLLLVHGGPGSVYSIFSPLLRSWEKDFTIVQWDQRGAGKTFRRNGKQGSGSLTFDRLAKDGIELSEYLCGKLQQTKLILVGSSAGSLTGIMMAARRPDLYHAYVGTDQNAPDPEHVGHRLLLEAFRTTGNRKGAELLERMGNDPSSWNSRDIDARNRLMVKAIRGVPNMITDLIMPSMLSSPEHTMRDMTDMFKGMKFSAEALHEDMVRFNFEKIGYRFELPVFIVQGDSDFITPTATAKAYYDRIDAPDKEFVLIHQAGHLACFSRPEQFFGMLQKKVRPLAAAVEMKQAR